MFLFFELFIFLIMYAWYYARKINNRLTRFVETGKYAAQLIHLSSDENIPKYATHLVYLTKANQRHEVEEKIIRSIFARKPKRADVYWFVHINRTDQPYTLSYDVSELAEGRLFKVNLHVGFRIQPKTELYFRKILQEILSDKSVSLPEAAQTVSPYHAEPDYVFVLIEKFLSAENDFSLRDHLLLNTYFLLKRMGLSEEKAFGLDKDDVVVEQYPLVYQTKENITLTRNQ